MTNIFAGKIKDMFKRLKEAKTQEQKDKVLAELQPVITYANIAMDECDFGTGLEMGIALFCSGLKELQTSAQKSLEVAYSLLGRHEFKKIIQVTCLIIEYCRLRIKSDMS